MDSVNEKQKEEKEVQTDEPVEEIKEEVEEEEIKEVEEHVEEVNIQSLQSRWRAPILYSSVPYRIDNKRILES